MENKTKFLEGFFDLANFISIFEGFNLTTEEMELLIFRFFKYETYERCAQLIGKKYTRQNVHEKIGRIIKTIRQQAQKQGRLKEFQFLLQDLCPRVYNDFRGN
jgi:hypothetical protein